MHQIMMYLNSNANSTMKVTDAYFHQMKMNSYVQVYNRRAYLMDFNKMDVLRTTCDAKSPRF